VPYCRGTSRRPTRPVDGTGPSQTDRRPAAVRHGRATGACTTGGSAGQLRTVQHRRGAGHLRHNRHPRHDGDGACAERARAGRTHDAAIAAPTGRHRRRPHGVGKHREEPRSFDLRQAGGEQQTRGCARRP